MNELQKKQLEILLEIDRVCNENNITYFLSSGTLLGAIRHKGFIPWDDDIDIIMDADDYWRFFSIAPKALGDNFFFQSTDTDLWYRAYSKVRYNNTTMIENCYENLKFHQGVWVDIFPLIGIKRNKKTVGIFNKIIQITDLMVQDAFFEKSDNLTIKLKVFSKIPISVRRKFCKKVRKLFIKSTKNTEFCDHYWGFPLKYPRFHSSLFKEAVRVPFEGYLFPVPKEYDKVLTIDYGDYMTPPPIDNRNSGHNIAILDLNKNYTEYIK